MSRFDLLPTEVLVEIFQRLPVKDILTMRRVSTRLKMVAREKEIWRGVVVYHGGLYYDNDYDGERYKRPTGRKLADLSTATTEELSWLVCRARVAVLSQFVYGGKIPDILHNIVEERREELELLQRKKIVQLEYLKMISQDSIDVDLSLIHI